MNDDIENKTDDKVDSLGRRIGKRRGFAAMDPEKVRAIASKGGKTAHEKGTAHQFTTSEAKVAGHKGGKAPHVKRGRGKRQTELDFKEEGGES